MRSTLRALSACFFADCGGTGERVLACDAESGECRWFLHEGTVPSRYVTSDCPVSDVHRGAGGFPAWAFTEWAPTLHTSVAERARMSLGVLRHVGHAVTAAEPAASIAVAFVPGQPALMWPRVECPPDESFQLCVGSVSAVRESTTESIVLHFWGSDGSVLVEVARDGATARAFYVRDGSDTPPLVHCDGGAGGGVLRGTGTLTLEPGSLEHPETAHGRLVLRGAGSSAGEIVVTF